jgi:hypothetical protein
MPTSPGGCRWITGGEMPPILFLWPKILVGTAFDGEVIVQDVLYLWVFVCVQRQ